MFLALVSQYSIWKRMLSSEGSKKILESFAMASVKKASAQAAAPVGSQTLPAVQANGVNTTDSPREGRPYSSSTPPRTTKATSPKP